MYHVESLGLVVGICVTPDDFVAEILLTENLVQDHLRVVRLPLIKMKVKAAVVAEQLVNQNQSLAQEFDEPRTGDLILICPLVLRPAKILFGSERGYNLSEPDAGRTVGIAEPAGPLQFQQ